MINLKPLFTRPLKQVTNSVAIFALVVALIGFTDASYLTIEHFQGVIPPCSITAGCEEVLTSSYSIIFGIPVAMLGAFYYLMIMAGIFAYLESKNLAVLKWTLLATLAGFLFSLWFIYVQVFILEAYCVYCIGSAITSIVLFATAMGIFNSQSHFHA